MVPGCSWILVFPCFLLFLEPGVLSFYLFLIPGSSQIIIPGCRSWLLVVSVSWLFLDPSYHGVPGSWLLVDTVSWLFRIPGSWLFRVPDFRLFLVPGCCRFLCCSWTLVLVVVKGSWLFQIPECLWFLFFSYSWLIIDPVFWLSRVSCCSWILVLVF